MPEGDFRKNKGQFDAARVELDALGSAPVAPPWPILIITEPTIEGMVKYMADGLPTLGLMSNDAGSFIGGHAMTEEAKLRSAAGLSSIWDGNPLDRIRAGSEPQVIVASALPFI